MRYCLGETEQLQSAALAYKKKIQRAGSITCFALLLLRLHRSGLVYTKCAYLIRLLSIFVSSLCAHTMQMFPYFSLERAI